MTTPWPWYVRLPLVVVVFVLSLAALVAALPDDVAQPSTTQES